MENNETPPQLKTFSERISDAREMAKESLDLSKRNEEWIKSFEAQQHETRIAVLETTMTGIQSRFDGLENQMERRFKEQKDAQRNRMLVSITFGSFIFTALGVVIVLVQGLQASGN